MNNVPAFPDFTPSFQPFSLAFTPSEIAKELYMYPVWCSHYVNPGGHKVSRESCPSLLLVTVCKGDMELLYREQKYIIKTGETFLLNCKEAHTYIPSLHTEYISLYFGGVNAHNLVDYLMEQHTIVYEEDECREIQPLLLGMVNRLRNDEIILAPEFSLIIYQMLISLFSSQSSLRNDNHPVNQAIQYVRKNIGGKLTLDILAEQTNLSKFHFSHIFKLETGYSPMEYVISVRLDHAKLLLKTTTMSIREIASAVGYDNLGSFINMFTAKVGSSPSAFRKI